MSRELRSERADPREAIEINVMRCQNLAESFRHAFHGFAYVVRTQPNVRVHILIAIVALALAVALRVNALEFALVVTAIVIVFVAEFLNTAVEAAVDLSSPHRHHLARIAKDSAAGAVLIAALGAIAIGVMVLGPHLWQIVTDFRR